MTGLEAGGRGAGRWRVLGPEGQCCGVERVTVTLYLAQRCDALDIAELWRRFSACEE